MAIPKHRISLDVQVGIYSVEYVARIYNDKIIVVSPYVKWTGNTGGYAESKETIQDQKVVNAVIADVEDQCEDSAWQKIGQALDDDYLYYRCM